MGHLRENLWSDMVALWPVKRNCKQVKPPWRKRDLLLATLLTTFVRRAYWGLGSLRSLSRKSGSRLLPIEQWLERNQLAQRTDPALLYRHPAPPSKCQIGPLTRWTASHQKAQAECRFCSSGFLKSLPWRSSFSPLWGAKRKDRHDLSSLPLLSLLCLHNKASYLSSLSSSLFSSLLRSWRLALLVWIAPLHQAVLMPARDGSHSPPMPHQIL